VAESVIRSLPTGTTNDSGGLKLTPEMFEAAIARQQRPTLAEQAAGLSHLQVHLLAAACRLYFLPDSKKSVGDVLNDMDKLTGFLRRKEVSIDMAYLALHNLSEINFLWLTNGTTSSGSTSLTRVLSTQHISHSTAVHLVPPPEEVQNLFHLKPLRCREVKQRVTEPKGIVSSISAAFTAVTGFESPLTVRAIAGEDVGLHPDLSTLRSKRKRATVVPSTGGLLAGLFNRSAPSSSSSTGNTNAAAAAARSTNDNNSNKTEKQWENAWYCDESFCFRSQPTLVVTDRVRKSVAEPHVPILSTVLN